MTIPNGQPIELMVINEVNDPAPGRIINLRINRPVMVDGRVILPAGTMAYGEIVSATAPDFLEDDGEVTARLLSVDIGGIRVPLASDIQPGAGVVRFQSSGALTLGLFETARIKANALIYGTLARDTPIDMSSGVARVYFGPPAGK